MKDNFTKEFFTFIDKNMEREDVAKDLGNSTKTISTWKSIGIPKGKRFACQALMDKATEQNQAELDDIRNTLVMHPTHAQFTNWNKVALRSGQTIEDWAFEGLEQLAAEHFAQTSSLHVANEGEAHNAYTLPLTAAAAGLPITTDISEEYAVSEKYPEGYFAVKAFGESMHPVIPNGATSLIMGRELWKNPHLKKGQIYTFTINGEQTIKRYNTRPATPNEIERELPYIYLSSENNKPSVKILESINPDFPEIIIENGDVEPTGWFEKLLK